MGWLEGSGLFSMENEGNVGVTGRGERGACYSAQPEGDGRSVCLCAEAGRRHTRLLSHGEGDLVNAEILRGSATELR